MPKANKNPDPSTNVDRLLESYTRAEEKLAKVQKKKLIFITIALALVSIVFGILIGVLISPEPINQTNDINTEDKVVSYTGIIRNLGAEQNGAIYYLERENETRVLLTSSQFDLSFFVGSAVTVEGISTGSADDGSEIVSVDKIRIKGG